MWISSYFFFHWTTVKEIRRIIYEYRQVQQQLPRCGGFGYIHVYVIYLVCITLGLAKYCMIVISIIWDGLSGNKIAVIT
jgi:hypothetical protein